MGDLPDVFMRIARLHGDDRCSLQGRDVLYQRVAFLLRVRVGQDKKLIITHGCKERLQIGFEVFADYYFLSGHHLLYLL